MSKRFALIGNQAFSLVNFRGTLLRDLASRGGTCFALAPDFTAETEAKVREFGATPIEISLSRTGMNPAHDVTTYLALVDILRAIQPDVVLSYAYKPAILGTLAARAAGVPRRFAMIEGLGWTFGQGGDVVERIKRQTARLASIFLYRRALEAADGVFFLNDEDITEFQRLRLVNESQSIMMGAIGVNLSDWTRKTPMPSMPTFVLLARMIREKGIYDFVEAARLLRREKIEARFLLLGGLDSNPAAIARSELQSWVGEGVIEWPGHVDAKSWLEKGTVFVLPSYYREGVPRSIQEAMALGMPIITTNVPGCRDTVNPGVNGLLVRPNDPHALATAMRHLAVNPLIAEEMGRNSLQMAKERYDDKVINSRVLDAMHL